MCFMRWNKRLKKNPFIAGNEDVIMRSPYHGNAPTYISSGLRVNLMVAAMRKACEFYSNFFDRSISHLDYSKLVGEYDQVYSHAVSLGLFQRGGVREKDHLNFWCLNRVLCIDLYVESGVFIGSSLHAFIKSTGVKRVIAIDPNLGLLKIPKEEIPGAILIDDKDFSQVEIDHKGQVALVFFDDHINTADRILQAAKKGFRYILFDDSTGLEGVCQRLYPAIPTIPMIVDAGLLKAGDELSWSFTKSSESGLKGILKNIILRGFGSAQIRVSLTITQHMVDRCLEANQKIKRCHKIPDLGEFIPQPYPEKLGDMSKYIIELN